LARASNREPGITGRFELFITGREIANGFSELNDAEDQGARFATQAAAKDAADEEAMYYDADFIRARIRHAARRWLWHRHRPPGDPVDRLAQHSRRHPVSAPASRGLKDADVLIIGASIAGASAAYFARLAGRQPTAIDAGIEAASSLPVALIDPLRGLEGRLVKRGEEDARTSFALIDTHNADGHAIEHGRGLGRPVPDAATMERTIAIGLCRPLARSPRRRAWSARGLARRARTTGIGLGTRTGFHHRAAGGQWRDAAPYQGVTAIDA
jgi:hypothetical protein